MSNLIKGLNLFFSQILKSLQFLLIVLVIVTSKDVAQVTTMWEFTSYFTFMVIASACAGYCYMKFYEQYMNEQLKEEMQRGELVEPDDVG